MVFVSYVFGDYLKWCGIVLFLINVKVWEIVKVWRIIRIVWNVSDLYNYGRRRAYQIGLLPTD